MSIDTKGIQAFRAQGRKRMEVFSFFNQREERPKIAVDLYVGGDRASAYFDLDTAQLIVEALQAHIANPDGRNEETKA